MANFKYLLGNNKDGNWFVLANHSKTSESFLELLQERHAHTKLSPLSAPPLAFDIKWSSLKNAVFAQQQQDLGSIIFNRSSSAIAPKFNIWFINPLKSRLRIIKWTLEYLADWLDTAACATARFAYDQYKSSPTVDGCIISSIPNSDSTSAPNSLLASSYVLPYPLADQRQFYPH